MDFDDASDDSLFRLPTEKFKHIISILVKCAPSRAKQRALLKAGRCNSESLSTLFWLSDYERQQIVFGVTDLTTTIMCAVSSPVPARLSPIAYNLQSLRDYSRAWQRDSIVEVTTNPSTLITTLSAIREGELYPYSSRALPFATSPMLPVPPLPSMMWLPMSHFNLTEEAGSEISQWLDNEKLAIPRHASNCLRTLQKNGWSGSTQVYRWDDNLISVHTGEMWMTTQATAYTNKHQRTQRVA